MPVGSPPKAKVARQDLKSADKFMVGWMLTATANFFADLGAVGAVVIINIQSLDQLSTTSELVPLYLGFVAIILSVISHLLTAAVHFLCPVKPPRLITAGVLVIAIAPFGLYLFSIL